jgi:hypothetical protein
MALTLRKLTPAQHERAGQPGRVLGQVADVHFPEPLGTDFIEKGS